MIGGDGINDESNKTAPAPTRNTDLTKNTGVFPRLTPRMPSPRMMFITWSRPTSAGSQPCANNWAWTFLYPYTAMRKSEWISRMSRAKASWRATSGLAAGS